MIPQLGIHSLHRCVPFQLAMLLFSLCNEDSVSTHPSILPNPPASLSQSRHRLSQLVARVCPWIYTPCEGGWLARIVCILKM